jgi:hypothetical protein
MIDWWPVLTNALWIIGLTTALAIFSWADWRASQEGKGLRSAVRYLAHSPSFAVSIVLVALGACLAVVTWLERVVWLLLAAAFAVLAIRAWSRQRKDPQGGRSGTAN